MLHFRDFKALTFDCYGTLIDWETGILAILRPWADRHGLDLDNDTLLASYGRQETRWESQAPTARYPDILRIVQAELARQYDVPMDKVESNALADSVRDWPAFADSPDALRSLKKTHTLVILSNIDRASFAHSNAKLGVEFDDIITAEDVHAYKPALRHFQTVIERLGEQGVDRSEILHVAQSLYHDHVPAKRLGLKTVWVNRRQGKPGWGATPAPEEEVQPDLVVGSMAELAALAVGS